MTSSSRLCAFGAAALLLSGCVTPEERAIYAAPDAGFANVALLTQEASAKETTWVQSGEQAEALARRIQAMVRGKTLSADAAVQVALLNNKGLQAAYADVGISAAEAWQQTLLPNPKVSIGVLGIGAPGLGAFRAIEGMIANNILAMTTQRRRVDLADGNFRIAQLRAISQTLQLAFETRTAWIDAVAAFETVYYLNQAQGAADAASQLAQKLGETGALTKSGQAREHAFFAELTGQTAQARLAAQLAKEKLARLMGLWGDDLGFFVPDRLPALPHAPARKRDIEAEALQRRVDLQLARLELDATAQSFGLTEATRFVSDFEILAGFEKEREIETEYEIEGDELKETVTRSWTVTPQVEVEFVIPVFDSGEARLRKAELAYMRAANLLAEKAVNVRSEARSAHAAYKAGFEIARHFQNEVLPLRAKIEEESLLTYNGMITSTFELLADTRARIGSVLAASNARRDFWRAEANLSAAIHGGSPQAGEAGPGVTLADNAGGH